MLVPVFAHGSVPKQKLCFEQPLERALDTNWPIRILFTCDYSQNETRNESSKCRNEENHEVLAAAPKRIRA